MEFALPEVLRHPFGNYTCAVFWLSLKWIFSDCGVLEVGFGYLNGNYECLVYPSKLFVGGLMEWISGDKGLNFKLV